MKKKILSLAIITAMSLSLCLPASEVEAANDNLIIVLDPGHGGSDTGAVASTGLQEKAVNLKIALYMKTMLEEYYGVEVYSTRTTDTYVGLEDRAIYAKSKNADIFISVHANSSTSSSASGAEVYYPNGNYTSAFNTSVTYATTKTLAQKIQDGYVAMGLTNRGIKIRNASEYKYTDGSAADYYSVIRNCKTRGIPSLLLEHAFLSNASDVSKYLNTDTKLKALATSNVNAIVSTLGLSKTSVELELTPPTKTEYAIGESLDTTGMIVKASLNGAAATVLNSSDYTVSGFSSTSSGNKVVSVTYQNKSLNFLTYIMGQDQTASGTSLGDVNGDGDVKASDYLVIKDSIMNEVILSEKQTSRADVKVDGEIKASDYLMIKDYIMGILDSLEATSIGGEYSAVSEYEINVTDGYEENEEENIQDILENIEGVIDEINYGSKKEEDDLLEELIDEEDIVENVSENEE